MPLYEYLCHSCGQTIEVIQKFSDPPLVTHEVCGGELEKLISRSAIQFKGSGWYVTDYGKGGVVPKNNEGKAGDSKGSDSKSGESGAGDSKSSDSKSSDSSSADTKTPAKSSESKSSDTASKSSTPAAAPTT